MQLEFITKHLVLPEHVLFLLVHPSMDGFVKLPSYPDSMDFSHDMTGFSLIFSLQAKCCKKKFTGGLTVTFTEFQTHNLSTQSLEL